MLTLWNVRTVPTSKLYLETFDEVCDLARQVLELQTGDTQAQSLLEYTERVIAAVRTPLQLLTPEERARDQIKDRFAAISRSADERDLRPAAVFEYDVVDVLPGDARTVLAQAGSLGWELVGVTTVLGLGENETHEERLY